MRTRTNKLKDRLAARLNDGHFAEPTVPALLARPVAELDEFKNRLLREELARAATLDMTVHLRRAANDAAALVWLTPFPLLFLPGLFEEKASVARKNAARAALIRERSGDLLALAE